MTAEARGGPRKNANAGFTAMGAWDAKNFYILTVETAHAARGTGLEAVATPKRRTRTKNIELGS